ncbi:glutathione S-transferase C-terminal domain-containing protein homolog [Atheta coriaria]|uniref:glutathione S-transferase C-terminal domain-containing protein homolog n=1 Tax=Dalotia coriaria TaxID=877792 RepID=UPI0031F3E017
MAATLYINTNSDNIHDTLEVDLETLLVLNVYKICDIGNIKLEIIPKKDLEKPLFKTKCDSNVTIGEGRPHNTQSEMVNYVKLPALVQDIQGSKSIVAGICSVARQLIKCSLDNNALFLLGFRESCLAACSESSIWTKFCEVDMVSTVRNVLNDVNENNATKLLIPDDLVRFEYHMQQPVRMHNVYKVARDTQKDKSIKSTVPISELNIPHCYSEGPAMTLADIILLPSIITLMSSKYSEEIFMKYLPLTYQWIQKMKDFDGYQKLVEFNLNIDEAIVNYDECLINQEIKKESLYTSDPNRYKPTNRIYTKQNDIESALNIIQSSAISIIENSDEPFGTEVEFNWEDIPMMLRPEGGALPKKRSKRKEEQLENLARAVVKLAKIGKTNGNIKIVDFCSGSGHLGLLLAHLLPDCTIILVENKEKSLERALDRIKSLNLSNVIVVQSNLDYFQGSFDIGVSLHACGVATDLVMQSCIDNRAHFVCCPCCYGGIHDCYHLKFPRSVEFQEGVQVADYLKIAHAADQTHDKENAKTSQGYHCMDIVDSDRWLYAKSCGYDVFLSKLKPETCTPKNNMLVGICLDN